MSAAVNYVLLKATAITGFFITFLNFADTANATDTAAKTVGKGLTETAQASETLVKSYGKAVSDTGIASDANTKNL